MKFNLLTAAAIALSATVFTSAVCAGDDHAPLHGGIVVPGKVFDLEIVARPGLIQVYAGDHGKPLKVDGAKGKVTLLSGAAKTELDLVVAGDKLEGKGDFTAAKGTKGIASVTLPGKPAVTARFELK